MYDFDHQLPVVNLTPIRKPHNGVAVDEADPLYDEPLVNLKDYDLPFLSWHAIADGSNAPYHKPIRGGRQEGWLRKTIADKLERVNKGLASLNIELLILDAYRSIECQKGFHDHRTISGFGTE